MHTSINFQVEKWQYNPKAPLINTHTDLIFRTHPLRSSNPASKGKAEGIGFKWILVLQANGLEVLYYSSMEMVLIPPENRNDEDIKKIAKETYDRSAKEVAFRNLDVGLDAGFPAFELLPGELEGIKEVLNK